MCHDIFSYRLQGGSNRSPAGRLANRLFPRSQKAFQAGKVTATVAQHIGGDRELAARQQHDELMKGFGEVDQGRSVPRI